MRWAWLGTGNTAALDEAGRTTRTYAAQMASQIELTRTLVSNRVDDHDDEQHQQASST